MRTALPDLSGVAHPRTRLLTSGQGLARWLLRRRLAITVHGADRVPASGPVVLAANHIGLVDGPLLGVYGPRPVHALTKQEMFDGRAGWLLRASGQIRLDRFHPDPGAVKTCLRVLADGHAVGIFPEGTRGAGDLARFHRGAAYLALVSGAPVVPVTFLGTRLPGGSRSSIPPRGARVEITYGAPYRLAAIPWPRTSTAVEHASLALRDHMLAAQDAAVAATGLGLPGPLPPGQGEADPATSVVPGGVS